MNNTKRRIFGGVTALAGILLTLSATGWGQNKPTRPSGLGTIGKFTIVFDVARIKGQRQKASDGEVELLRGPDGAPNAEIRSAQYDLAAPKITMGIKNRLLDTATASGGVRVITREKNALTGKLRESINLRSDNATFIGERKAKDGAVTRPSRLELRGNVKGTYLSSLFSESDPLKVDTDAVDIEFPDAETADVVLRNGTITGTPVEQPKTDKTGGKNP